MLRPKAKAVIERECRNTLAKFRPHLVFAWAAVTDPEKCKGLFSAINQGRYNAARMRRRQSALISLLLFFVIGACRPKNQRMLVAYLEGDVFLPSLHTSDWSLGEPVECEVASRTSVAPDKRGDLLLCGAQTQLAWSQTWLRPDIKSQLYNRATLSFVVFHSTGHGRGRYAPPLWTCRKALSEIDCE